MGLTDEQVEEMGYDSMTIVHVTKDDLAQLEADGEINVDHGAELIVLRMEN